MKLVIEGTRVWERARMVEELELPVSDLEEAITILTTRYPALTRDDAIWLLTDDHSFDVLVGWFDPWNETIVRENELPANIELYSYNRYGDPVYFRPGAPDPYYFDIDDGHIFEPYYVYAFLESDTEPCYTQEGGAHHDSARSVL